MKKKILSWIVVVGLVCSMAGDPVCAASFNHRERQELVGQEVQRETVTWMMEEPSVLASRAGTANKDLKEGTGVSNIERETGNPEREGEIGNPEREGEIGNPEREGEIGNPEREGEEGNPDREETGVSLYGEDSSQGLEGDTGVSGKEAGSGQKDIEVPIDGSTFPDPEFTAFIQKEIDRDGDKVLSQAEIMSVTSLDVSGKGIFDLRGIEVFTELQALDCSGNHLAALDVSSLEKLETLVCEENVVTAVADENGCFQLPLVLTENEGRIQDLQGAFLEHGVFTADKDQVSYKYDAGRGFQVAVCVQLERARRDISKASLGKITDVTYTGAAIQPRVSLTYGGEKIPETEYTVVYQDNINAGVAKIVISGKNSYQGQKQVTFRILPKQIKGCALSKVKDKTYTGKQVKPSVTLKDGVRKLKKDRDYSISYKNNKKIGKATIQVKGKGNYQGTKSCTFKILPQKVSSLKPAKKTSGSIQLKWKKVSSVTGYQIYRYNTKTKKYKKIKTLKGKKTTYTVKKLSPCTTYRFKVRAYKKLGKKTYYGAYSKVLKVQTKVLSPDMQVVSNRMGQASVSWNKVKKASGLELSFRNGNGAYQKVSDVTRNSEGKLYMSQLQVGATYTFRMRAYRMVNGKKEYGDYTIRTAVISGQASVLSGGNYSPGSVYGPSLSQGELNQVRERVQFFKDHYIDDSMSDYMKVKIAHDYLVSVCSYAASWAVNRANTAWGALVYGQAQCSGYARAMKALCDGIGIGCYYVHADGNASNPSHQWNTVCVDGKWYIVDVQCNDTSGGYFAFLVSDQTYSRMFGLSWDRNSVPACPEDYQRYYLKGRLFCGRPRNYVLYK